MTLFVKADQVAHHLINIAQVLLDGRHVQAHPLQVVIEVRQVHQREAGPVLFFHPLGRLRDPDGGLDPGARTPETGEGEGTEVLLDPFAHAHRLRVHVEVLPPIRRVQRAGGDRVVRTGVHVEPPEQLCAGEFRLQATQRFPQLLALHQVVALLPEAVLIVLPVIPAIGHHTVVARQLAGQVGSLGRARDRRHHRLDAGQLVALQEGTNVRRGISHEPRGEAHDIEDGSTLHGWYWTGTEDLTAKNAKNA